MRANAFNGQRRAGQRTRTLAPAQQQSSQPPRADERLATKGIASSDASRASALATIGWPDRAGSLAVAGSAARVSSLALRRDVARYE
jgi:hypothetical protein